MNNLLELKPMPRKKEGHTPTIIGHRGASGLAPEHTLMAFQKASDLKVDGVEFDVQRTADGHLVVFHDETLERTTNGRGFVKDNTLDEIKKLDAGSWFDLQFGRDVNRQFAGAKVLTLVEAFDFFRHTDLILHIELKSPSLYPNLGQQVVDLIREYQCEERVQIRSFDHAALKEVQEIAPEISVSGLFFASLPEPNDIPFRTINALYSLYTPEIVDMMHQHQKELTAWTVNDVQQAKKLMEMGIDGLTTDYPDRLVTLVEVM